MENNMQFFKLTHLFKAILLCMIGVSFFSLQAMVQTKTAQNASSSSVTQPKPLYRLYIKFYCLKRKLVDNWEFKKENPHYKYYPETALVDIVINDIDQPANPNEQSLYFTTIKNKITEYINAFPSNEDKPKKLEELILSDDGAGKTDNPSLDFKKYFRDQNGLLINSEKKRVYLHCFDAGYWDHVDIQPWGSHVLKKDKQPQTSQ